MPHFLANSLQAEEFDFKSRRHLLQFSGGNGFYHGGSYLYRNFIEKPSEASFILADPATRQYAPINDDIYYYIYFLQKKPEFRSMYRNLLYEYKFSRKFSGGVFADLQVIMTGNNAYLLPTDHYWLMHAYIKNRLYSPNDPVSFYLSMKNTFYIGPIPTIPGTAGIHAGYHPYQTSSLDTYIRFYLSSGMDYATGVNLIKTGAGMGIRYFPSDYFYLMSEADYFYCRLDSNDISPLSLQPSVTTHGGGIHSGIIQIGAGMNLNIFKKIKLPSRERQGKSIEEELGGIKNHSQITLKKEKNQIKILMQNDVVFESGSDELSDEGKKTLIDIARILKDENKKIIIEGHTDITPILRGKYRNNLELSRGRAESVYRIFLSKGMLKENMQISAWGSEKPVRSNDTEEGRNANRRIEIFILE